MLNPRVSNPISDERADALLRFNREVLGQALGLVAAYEQRAPQMFAEHAGPHLRHIVEHYEALLLRESGSVDYDARARDRDCERSTAVARARIEALQARLAGWNGAALAAPVEVRTLGGLAGEEAFASTSSVGRELMFLASHAVHHFAVLKLHGIAQGVAASAEFGKAPATVAHERSTQAA